MPSSISGESLSGGWSLLRIPGLFSPDMSWSIGTSDMSLRSEMDDTYRLDRIEFDRFDSYKQKENKFNHEKKNNKIEKHVQTASGSRPPRFSVATWINSWSSHSSQCHSCRIDIETARVFPRLVVIPQGIAEGDTSHGRKPWSQRGACRPLIAAPTGSRGRMDWQSLDKQELW